MLNKKSVSPLIATIVLISFTIAIGSLVINWAKQFITAQTQSLQQSGVQCQKESVEIVSAKVDNNHRLNFIIRNSGSVEFKFVKLNVYYSDGSVETVTSFTDNNANQQCGSGNNNNNNQQECKVDKSSVKKFTTSKGLNIPQNAKVEYIELPSKDCPQNLYYNYNVEQ